MKFIVSTWLAVSILLAAGCGQKNSAAKVAAPVPVLAAKAVAKTMPVRIESPPVGHVLPVSSVTIRPQIGGVISSVNFQEGQEVKKGDLLFTIDLRPAQTALTLAKGSRQRDAAQLDNAKIQFDRDEKLFEQKLISQDVFDTSKTVFDALAGTVAADGAAVTNAELNLQYCEIRAPIDGRTGGLQFHEGNVVKSPDDVLLTINQIHPIYAAFGVAERYLPEIQKQMRNRTLTVAASFENLEGEPPQGELSFVDNAVDATTGTILLKATFPNKRSVLWPGQFVQLALQLDELTNAVVVPSQAVQNGQNGQFVFVVKADQTVEQRAVKTSVTVKGETVIESGVNAGETVVTDGQLRLAPGVMVDDKSSNGNGK
ncbi:MAG TPA: efflux RND transporter periplasmic adaptor subunit [Verrucomicrobiae bacterium]